MGRESYIPRPVTTERTDVVVHEYRTTTEDGWSLELRRTSCPARLNPSTRPILLVPGYGMNNFILGYHPRGTSMERHFAEAGFEVWSVNMRGQGGSKPLRQDAPPPSIDAFVYQDAPTAVRAVADKTQTRSEQVILAGCSLGGTVAYACAAVGTTPAVYGIITLCGPLRWEHPHPLVRAVFSSPWLVGKFRTRGTRQAARVALPLAAKLPYLLDLYMNRRRVDMSATAEMVESVDDLHPKVNEAIARWIQQKDLIVGGVNVTEQLPRQKGPLLVVLANKDGIAPPHAILSVEDYWGGDVDILNIGDEDAWFAHADLFVANDAPSKVFTPITRWLEANAVF